MATAKAKKTDRIDISLDSECVGEGPRPVRVQADLERFAGSDLNWILSGTAGMIDSGKLAWLADDESHDELDLSLAPGRYLLTVTPVAQNQAVVDARFEVLGCVTARAGCHSVKFTNPEGNPAVRVRYDPAQDEDYPDQDSYKGGEAIIRPGESRAIEIFYFEIAWEANAADRDRDVVRSGAGERYSELPDQHCGPTMTRGTVRCAGSRRGIVDAWLFPPTMRGVRYRIVDDFEGIPVVRGRSVGPDGRAHSELPVGGYIFRSYTSTTKLPYDQASFSVPPCVTAVPKCREVKFSNPSNNAVEISYQGKGTVDRGTTRVAAGMSTTIPVSSSTLTWRAATQQTDTALWRLEPGHGSVRMTPKWC